MDHKIKIIFFGYDYLGGQFLQVLLNEYADKIEVVAVATNARYKKESLSKKYKQAKQRWQKGIFFNEITEKIIFNKLINEKLLKNPKPSYNDITVRQIAEKNSIPILDSSLIFSGDTQEISKYDNSFIVVASFGKVPEAIYAHKPESVLNFHPSYLPQLRGGSPVYTAIMRGMEQTGFSFHQLTQVFDAGPLRYQEAFSILPDDTNRQVEIKMAIAGAHTLYGVLKGIEDKTVGVIDIAGREITKCFRNYEISALLQPPLSTTEELLRKIKATASWPLGAAFIRKGFRHFYVIEAVAAQWDGTLTGENIIYKEPTGLLIKTKDGAVLVTKIYYQKKYYSGRELAQFKRILFDVVKN